jgi:hypothetical protein
MHDAPSKRYNAERETGWERSRNCEGKRCDKAVMMLAATTGVGNYIQSPGILGRDIKRRRGKCC